MSAHGSICLNGRYGFEPASTLSSRSCVLSTRGKLQKRKASFPPIPGAPAHVHVLGPFSILGDQLDVHVRA